MSHASAMRKVTVLNSAGLHARPSLAVAQAVRRSQSKVEVRTERQRIDAGDILQLLSLGATPGTELTFTATGPDAEQVLDELVKMFTEQFGLCGEAG
ncbi:MAG: HPr family phosphocarrier protein [Thermoguttaceae bacterium]